MFLTYRNKKYLLLLKNKIEWGKMPNRIILSTLKLILQVLAL